MKPTLLSIVLAMCFVFVKAQPNEYPKISEMGPVFKLENRAVPVDFIGHDERGYYFLYADGKFGNGETYIKKFNKDLTPSTEELKLEKDTPGWKNSTLGFIQIDNSIFHLSAADSFGVKKYQYQKVNLEDFSIEAPKVIAQLESEERSIKKSLKTFFVSEDTSKIILFYTIPNRGKDNQKVRTLTFNKKFELTETNDYEFPYTNKQFLIYDITLRKNGDLLLMAKNFIEKGSLKSYHDRPYEYILYNLSKGEVRKLTHVSTEGKYLRQLNLLEDGEDLVLTGFYAEINPYSIKGTFYFRMSIESTQMKAKHWQKFDENFFTLHLNEKKTERVKKRILKDRFEDSNYVLTRSFLDKKGYITLVAEQRHNITSNYSTTFYSQNLAIVKLDSEGKVKWSNKIGKDNSTSNAAVVYCYHIAIKKDSTINLIYNGTLANLNHTSGPVESAYIVSDKHALIDAQAFEDGSYKRKALATNELLGDIRIRPRLSNWLDKNTLLLFGQDHKNVKNQQFIKLSFGGEEIAESE